MSSEYTQINVKAFEVVGAGRNLLSSLGLFHAEATPDFRISLDHIVVNDADGLSVNERFNYSDYNIQAAPRFSNYAFSLPHTVTKGVVTNADVLGKRRFGGGESDQAIMADLVSQKAITQHNGYLRTKELQLAHSLFSNTVDLGVEGSLDVSAELGISQSVGTALDLSAPTTHPMKDIMGKRNQLVKSLQSLSNKVTGIFVFMGDEAFTALKYNDLIRDDYKHTVNPEVNPLVKFSEELEVFESMTLNNITFINVGMDSELAAVVGDDAFMVPRFSADAGVMSTYHGPAARNGKIHAVAPYYAYTFQDNYGSVSVESEFSSLPINKLPSAVLKFPVTLAA